MANRSYPTCLGQCSPNAALFLPGTQKARTVKARALVVIAADESAEALCLPSYCTVKVRVTLWLVFPLFPVTVKV